MNEAVRDAFITGLQFNVICQGLLEHKSYYLNTLFTLVWALDNEQQGSLQAE